MKEVLYYNFFDPDIILQLAKKSFPKKLAAELESVNVNEMRRVVRLSSYDEDDKRKWEAFITRDNYNEIEPILQSAFDVQNYVEYLPGKVQRDLARAEKKRLDTIDQMKKPPSSHDPFTGAD